jgi:hypothetical protein
VIKLVYVEEAALNSPATRSSGPDRELPTFANELRVETQPFPQQRAFSKEAGRFSMQFAQHFSVGHCTSQSRITDITNNPKIPKA